MTHRSYHGKIAYLHDTDGELGREWFHITVDEGEQRTLRSVVEMDDVDLVRDVTYTVSADWRPQEAYVRLSQNGAFKGSAWFLFLDDRAECEGFNQTDGRFRQTIPLNGSPRAFGPHPVVCDGWQAALFDPENPDHHQVVSNCLTTSSTPDGSTGPFLEVHDHGIEFVGEQELTVPAGVFSVGHYRVHLSNPEWPPLEIWVTPQDRQLVRLSWSVSQSRYDLVEVHGSFS